MFFFIRYSFCVVPTDVGDEIRYLLLDVYDCCLQILKQFFFDITDILCYQELSLYLVSTT